MTSWAFKDAMYTAELNLISNSAYDTIEQQSEHAVHNSEVDTKIF